MEKPILITSASLDEHTFGPVRSILEDRGYPVVVYKTDDVLTNSASFYLDIRPDGEITIKYDGQHIGPEDIHAAWYRKLGNFDLEYGTQDRAKQLYIHRELQSFHETVWDLYPDSLWLNAPNAIRRADTKLGQLLVAQEVGFITPKTVAGNEWDTIEEALPLANQKIVVKMMRGVISEKETMKAVYTIPLDKAAVDTMREQVTPFPGIYQPFLAKFREWRVTVVGDDVFAAAIYTDPSAKDDWRKHQLTAAVSFKKENFPETPSDQCIRYLRKMNLGFGAFDFIEEPDGKITFLECNPNGQYMWLEEGLGLPISQAVADELVKTT